MKQIKDRFQQFLNEEAGQSTTEYILILAVVVMIAMKFKTGFNKTMGNQLKNLDNTLNDAFKPD